MAAASPASTIPSVARSGMVSYPPSGIRWAAYSLSEDPLR